MNYLRAMRMAVACLALSFAVVAQSQVNTWQLVSHMKLARSVAGTATGIDGRIYVVGGQATDGSAIAEVEAYDTQADTWTVLPSMPQGRMMPSVLPAPDGRIFVVGGNDSAFAFISSVVVYDPTTNAWTHVTDIPAVGFNSVVATLTSSGQIFVFPNSLGGTGTAEVYTISTDTWAAATFPITSQSNAPSVARLGDKIYFVGGINAAFNPVNTLSVFDTSNYSFNNLAAMAVVRVNGPATFGGDGRLYTMSGEFGSPLHDSEAYDPATNTWSDIAPVLLDSTGGMAAQGPNGRIYFMGGITQTDVDTVEMYQPALLKAQGVAISAQEGVSFTGVVSNITDANLNLSPGDFTISINWGDGSAPTTGSVASGVQRGSFMVTGTHTYANSGSFATSISISNSDGESKTVAGSASVTDAALNGNAINFNASTHIAFSGKVATFTDANTLETGSHLSATINWGDGSSTSSGTITLNAAGGFDVNGSHTYSVAGVYTFGVLLTDSGGSSKNVLGTATVSFPAPLLTAATINATEGAVFSGTAGSFSDADPTAVAGSFTATIDWGDGTTTSGGISPNAAGGFNVTGLHTYSEEGVYTTHVTVTAVAGSSSSAQGGAVVADAPLTGSGFNLIVKSRTFNGTVANFTDADPFGVVGDFTATIFWGDGATTSGTISAVTGGFKVVGTHTYLKKAVYAVKVTIKDAGGATAVVTTTINASQAK